ncbi:hypothetical protein [Corynebacterium casei]
MKIALPSDCGNSPRMALVADLAVAWAADDKDTLDQWLADDPSWSTFGPALPETAISQVVVLGAINHGRAASCDGYLEFADSEQSRVRFSHVFAFSSTTKTAKVKAVRTYLTVS